MRVRLFPLIAVAATLLLAASAAAAPLLRSPGFRGGTPRVVPVPVAPEPAVVAQTGENPDVLVDAAGTSHIVWNEPGTDGPDVTVYCRLPRAATACEVIHRLVPPLENTSPANAESASDDTFGPRVTAINDQVAVLSYRYPYSVPKPSGDPSRSLYLWTSDDGGRNFGAPGLIGTAEVTGDVAVFGPADAPYLGALSDTRTGGTVFSASRSGQFTDAAAVVGPGDQAYEGSIAVTGGLPSVAFEGLNRDIRVRRWTGSGDPNDVATWSAPVSLTGERPRLAAAGDRLHLLYRPALGGPYVLRDLDAGREAAVTPADVGFDRALTEDGAGGLVMGYRSGIDRYYVRRLLPGAATAEPAVLIATGVVTASRETALGATADGGGVAAFRRETGGIAVAAFGSRAPTGLPGLGGAPGAGAVGADVVLDCGRVRIGAVQAALPAGCFFGTTRGGARVTEGVLRLNGLEIVPEAGVQVVIDPRARTLYSTGDVRVLLRAPGVPDITLFRGRLALQLSAARVGDSLLKFPDGLFRPVVQGFPVRGDIDVRLTATGVRIPVHLELPAVFGGVRGDATLVADTLTGLRLDSLRFEVERVLLGPVELRRLKVTYTSGPSQVEVGCIRPAQRESSPGDTWTGEFELGLPPRPAGANVCGAIRFQQGRFQGTTFRIDLPYPGITLFPGVSLLSLGGGLALQPLQLIATTRIGVIPAAADAALVTLDGRLDARFGTPFTLRGTGEQRVAGVLIGTGGFTLSSDGYVAVGVSSGVRLPGLWILGDIRGFADGPRREFSLSGGARVCLGSENVCVDGARAVVSTRGIAACAPAPSVPRGGGYRWGDTLPDIWLLSCDASDYEVADVRAARVAGQLQAGGGAVTVPAGQPWIQFRVTAAAAPRVRIVGPGGVPVTPSASVATPDGRTLFIGVLSPAAGDWRVEPEPGGPALTEVAVSRAVTPAAVRSARVTGAGTGRTVVYRAAIAAGQGILLAERGAAGTRVLGRLRDGAGTVRFTPSPGPGGPRTIIAVIEQDGIARQERVVARYTAPPPPRPGAVRRLSVRRTAAAVVATWIPGRGAVAQAVTITLPDGGTEVRILGPRARRVSVAVPRTRRVVAGISRPGRARAVVAALDGAGRRGPRVTAASR